MEAFHMLYTSLGIMPTDEYCTIYRTVGGINKTYWAK